MSSEKEKRSPSYVDIIFFVAILILLIWAILKVFGIINTPVWIEMIPVFTAIFGGGAFYMKVCHMDEKVTKSVDKAEDVDKRLIKIESTVCLREHFLQKTSEMNGRLIALENPARRKGRY